MLMGQGKHGGKVWQLLAECKANGDKIPVEAYNLAIERAYKSDGLAKAVDSVKELLVEMRDTGLAPTNGTLCSILALLAQFSRKNEYEASCRRALDFLAEFRVLGVEFSLGVYKNLLDVYVPMTTSGDKKAPSKRKRKPGAGRKRAGCKASVGRPTPVHNPAVAKSRQQPEPPRSQHSHLDSHGGIHQHFHLAPPDSWPCPWPANPGFRGVHFRFDPGWNNFARAWPKASNMFHNQPPHVPHSPTPPVQGEDIHTASPPSSQESTHSSPTTTPPKKKATPRKSTKRTPEQIEAQRDLWKISNILRPSTPPDTSSHTRDTRSRSRAEARGQPKQPTPFDPSKPICDLTKNDQSREGKEVAGHDVFDGPGTPKKDLSDDGSSGEDSEREDNEDGTDERSHHGKGDGPGSGQGV